MPQNYTLLTISLVLAKTSEHVLNPERFALHIGTFFVSKYPHIHKSFIDIEQLRWSRIPVDGDAKGHPHSFVRDGDDKRVVSVEVGCH
jgi:urate oxidase